MRLVLTFLMAMSAVAVLVLGAAPASAMTGQGGCHEAAAAHHDGGEPENPTGMDAHVMHCCVACTPLTVLPVVAPLTLAGPTRPAMAPSERLGRVSGPDPDPPRV